MRMNKQAGKTAADVVNDYDEEQLADIFYLYGELKNARKLAAAIDKARQAHRIATTGELLQVTEQLFPREREKKEMAKLFQALRIEVNHEMEALKEMLNGSKDLLGEGGRLSVITYHSLEDRLVKNMMKAGNTEGKVKQDFFGHTEAPFKPIGKVIVPEAEEQERNPRSRSAKLRIAEKVKSE
jgi:16S rRNA (cytosine1402-N4)-methyltransferase